ncbi:MAG: flagellar biosynthetic protein FliO [Burkholderiaceae bacterium]
MPAPSPQTLWSLLVLGSLFVAALVIWARNRLDILPRKKSASMRVVESLPLGPRERAVLIEIQGRRLLLGVTAQSVCRLQELDQAERASPEDPSAAAPEGSQTSFADALARAGGS